MQIRTDNTETLKNALKRIEELEKACNETQELLDKQIEATLKLDKEKQDLRDNYDLFKAIAEPEIERLNKENEELKKEISNLLSCKNCPENKGGYICQKEYEDKCLTQKIQYIKELQEENAELKGEADSVLNNWCKGDAPCPHLRKRNDQLTKAKEIIKELLDTQSRLDPYRDIFKDRMLEAEQFLNSEVEK